jgi:hypothetical protein
MFGIDLISLGKGRVLSVIDFQPIHPTAEYSEKYISNMTDVRAKYPGMKIFYVSKVRFSLNNSLILCMYMNI